MRFLNRMVSLIVVTLLFALPLLNCAMNVFASNTDINNPPEGYPENVYKFLDGDLTYNGDFTGDKCYQTHVAFDNVNIKKYTTWEFDVYIGSNTDSEVSFLFDFLDSKFNNSLIGRGQYNIGAVKTNEWHHISINTLRFETGYGMSGDETDVRGYMVESYIGTPNCCYIRNMCLTATGIVSPDNLPDKVIKKVGAALNVEASDALKENEREVTFDKLDVTYGDFLEFDYYVESKEKSGGFSLILFDADGNGLSSTINCDYNQWNHIKFDCKKFRESTAIDFTAVCGYRIDSLTNGNIYHIDNLCTTGIAWPLEYPDNVAVKLGGKIDCANTSSAKNTVTKFDAVADFTKYDFFEFDVYVESANNQEEFYLFTYDSGYSGGSSLPAASNRLQDTYTVDTNRWVHITVLTSSLGSKAGSGNRLSLVGFYISKLSKSNRYILVNPCLTNIVVPETSNSFNLIKDTKTKLDYSGKSGISDKVLFEEPLDCSDAAFIEFDIYNASSETKVTETFVITDSDGGSASQKFVAKSNSWQHLVLRFDKFDGSIDLSKISGYYLNGVTVAVRNVVANVCVTDIVTPEMNNQYKLTEKINVSYDIPQTNVWDTKKSMFEDNAVKDLSKYQFIEMDVCFEEAVNTGIMRLFLVDSSDSKMLFYDIKAEQYTVNNGWLHVVAPIASFNNGYGYNGDITCIKSLMIEPLSGWVHIENMCFTELEMPEMNNKYSEVIKTNITADFSDFYGNASFSTARYFTEDKTAYDISTPMYFEFDAFLECEDSEKLIAMYFVDSTFSSGNTGRGMYKLNVRSGEWHHYIIDGSTFETGYGMNGKMSDCIGFSFESTDSDEMNFHITNVCLTMKDRVPNDIGQKPVKPDSASMYISDCESLMSDEGIWNTSGAKIYEIYKTENKGSVGIKLTDSGDTNNSLRFLFNGYGDFSSANSIKFDLFIDDAKLAARNKFCIVLTSNKRFTSKNFKYTIDGATLKLGWNSINVPISSFIADTGADISKIYGLSIGLVDTVMDSDEYMNMLIDNLRAYKKYKFIPGGEGDSDIFDDDDDSIFDGMDDFIFDDEPIEDPSVDVDATEGNSNKKVVRRILHRKRTGSGYDVDLIVLISVSAGCAVVVAAGVLFAILTEKKYRKLLATKMKQ